MLNIRNDQFQTFEASSLVRFEKELILHSKEFSPKLTEILGDEQVQIIVKQAMTRSNTYDFTLRGPIRLYLEMTFLYGSDFDTDPQYNGISLILNEEIDQIARSEKIVDWIVNYNKRVSGKNNSYVYDALKALYIFAQANVKFNSYTFVDQMNEELSRSFPQKATFLGKEKMTELILQGCAKSERQGFNTIQGQTLIVVLMFAFGIGCLNDPLYPWISKTLQSSKIKTTIGREKRLKRKALTWLEQVLNSAEKQGEAT